MKKIALPKMNTGKLTRTVNRAGLKLKKHSPTILVTAGIVGVVGSTVLACRATLKLNEVLEPERDDLAKVHEYAETHDFSEKYTEQDYNTDIRSIYLRSAGKVVKLYAPAVITGALSITAIIGSHKILNTRNAAISAAYAGVLKDFKDYRGRVIERFGHELDNELRYNVHAEEVKETTVDEDGSETTETKTVNVSGVPQEFSELAVCFDDKCKGWNSNPEFTKAHLLRVQDYFNQRLKSVGHVFLNEIYEAFGLQGTKSGHMIGWVYNEEDSSLSNCIDFGLFETYKEQTRDFMNGRDKFCWVDFNIDGNIYDILY